MFSYYGSKSRIIRYYPKPKHDLIIEPFAGSARYALEYFDKEVILIDKDINIIDVWTYLQEASVNDLLRLPILKPGNNLKDFNLSDKERKFLGFLVQRGSSHPGWTYSAWKDTNCSPTVRGDIERIAADLYKIKHWKIYWGDYTEAPSSKATWFIDPPCFQGGNRYRCSNKTLNYQRLGDWVKSRQGQTIVCENASADWLPFLPLIQFQGLRKVSREMIWTGGDE